MQKHGTSTSDLRLSVYFRPLTDTLERFALLSVKNDEVGQGQGLFNMSDFVQHEDSIIAGARLITKKYQCWSCRWHAFANTSKCTTSWFNSVEYMCATTGVFRFR